MPWEKYNFSQKPKTCCNKPVSKVKSTCVDVVSQEPQDCENYSVPITALSTGAIAKIPVVLAEFTVQINLDSFITLPEPAYEIKNVKKRVKVTQCLLLQNTNMLFIKGFIRKNIDYSTRECSNTEGFCGDIKHCTADIPFSCTTPVNFNGISPLNPRMNKTSEFEYFREEEIKNTEATTKDKLLSGDLREFNQISTEFFNELPFCELVSAKIVEFDEIINPTYSKKEDIPFEEKAFRKIEEKMVIYLTLKLLQKRQVAIGPVGGGYGGIKDCFVASEEDDIVDSIDE